MYSRDSEKSSDECPAIQQILSDRSNLQGIFKMDVQVLSSPEAEQHKNAIMQSLEQVHRANFRQIKLELKGLQSDIPYWYFFSDAAR